MGLGLEPKHEIFCSNNRRKKCLNLRVFLRVVICKPTAKQQQCKEATLKLLCRHVVSQGKREHAIMEDAFSVRSVHRIYDED
jgi:hypothetical protein